MGLVVGVGQLTGIGARGVDKGDDRHRIPFVFADDFDGLAVVLGTPDAVIGVAFLGQQAEPPLAAVKVKLGLDTVQGAERDFIHYFKFQLFQNGLEPEAPFLLGRFDGFSDIGIDVQALETLGGLFDGTVVDETGQGQFHFLLRAGSIRLADSLEQ